MEIATYAVLDDGSCIPVKIDPQNFQEKYSDRVIIFIIEDLKRVFIWVGKNASVRQKFISSRVAQQLRMELGLGLTFKVRNVEQGMESTEFIEALKKATTSKANVPSPVDHVVPTQEVGNQIPLSQQDTDVPSPTAKQELIQAPPIPTKKEATTITTTRASFSKNGEDENPEAKRTEMETLDNITPDNLPTVSGIHSDNKSYINAWYPGPIILRKAVRLLSTDEIGTEVAIQHMTATSFPINQDREVNWWMALFIEKDGSNIKDCRESPPIVIISFNPNHTTVSLPLQFHVEKGQAIYISFTNPTYLSLQFKSNKKN